MRLKFNGYDGEECQRSSLTASELVNVEIPFAAARSFDEPPPITCVPNREWISTKNSVLLIHDPVD
jgi:hypothetical protein